MDARRFIRVKRDRGVHSPEDIQAFVAAGLRGEIPDYQIGAWLMAALLNGLDWAETDALTDALVRSGRVFDWSPLGRPSADKHSTGGVGDKVSLVLAPLVAACGVVVPMVSGRGLGHTGGTLDKLESIPGFRTHLSEEEMQVQLERIGVVMVGQGPDLAPADGMLYALRDATSTVEFEPFIVSSIVSKKIAEGAGTVVYDVKCGNGAFMTTREAARSLGQRLVRTTRALGRGALGLISDMNQPTGQAIGNALEVCEALDVLRGGGPEDVRTLTLELAGRMLHGAGVEPSFEHGCGRAARALDQGAALERFMALVDAQGADARILEQPERMAPAPVRVWATATRSGWLAGVDTFGLGELGVAIGAGRRHKAQAIDPRVGLRVKVRIGDRIDAGMRMAELHLAAADPGAVACAEACFRIANEPPQIPPLVWESLDEREGKPAQPA